MAAEVYVSREIFDVAGQLVAIGVLGAFSRKMREWFLRRDGFRCQDPDCSIKRPDGKGLHVHHVVPQGWWERWFGPKQLGEEAESPHQPWNGITLCAEGHHNGRFGVHPDYNDALIKYRGGDKRAFKEVAEKHGRKADRGERYWDEKKDGLYFDIAEERTKNYSEEHPDDPFPFKD